MSESLEVRTSHREVADLVRELAPFVDERSLRLPSGRKIADGEWVRFRVALADGSSVLEGVGRCEGSRQEGASTYRVCLSLLSFDARNEVMYERMCLARDSMPGEATGTLDLRALGRDLLAPPSPPPLPPRRSAPRPATRPPPPSRLPPARPAAPPPPPEEDRPRPKPGRKEKDKKKEKKRERKKEKKREKKRERKAAARALPRPAPIELAATAERTSPGMMAPGVPTTDTILQGSADLEGVERGVGLRLEIPSRLVERARALAPTLPAGLATPTPARETPEEAVLRVALRLGLASLAALLDVDDEP